MRFLYALPLLLALTACDFLPGDYNDYGEMTATVTGALDLRLHGTALVTLDDGRTTLYLDVTNDFARYITITAVDTSALAVGRYALADGTLTAAEYQVDNRTERLFTATETVLVITSVDADGDLRGRFEFAGQDPDGAQVAVVGQFRARDRRDRYGLNETP